MFYPPVVFAAIKSRITFCSVESALVQILSLEFLFLLFFFLYLFFLPENNLYISSNKGRCTSWTLMWTNEWQQEEVMVGLNRLISARRRAQMRSWDRCTKCVFCQDLLLFSVFEKTKKSTPHFKLSKKKRRENQGQRAE